MKFLPGERVEIRGNVVEGRSFGDWLLGEFIKYDEAEGYVWVHPDGYPYPVVRDLKNVRLAYLG